MGDVEATSLEVSINSASGEALEFIAQAVRMVINAKVSINSASGEALEQRTSSKALFFPGSYVSINSASGEALEPP